MAGFLTLSKDWITNSISTEGVAGASMFRADAAVIVTWYNTASAISGRSDIDSGQTATYQVYYHW